MGTVPFESGSRRHSVHCHPEQSEGSCAGAHWAPVIRELRTRRTRRLPSRLIITAIIATAALAAACGGGDKEDPTAEPDPSLPGTFVAAQGRGHFNYTYSREREPKPFCEGVATADAAGAAFVVVPTPESGENACYSSNPPSSGWHLGGQRNVDLGNGIILSRIPPDPDMYPQDVVIPREGIPHILEHAGVFVGYHCGGDTCENLVPQLEDIVNDRIDNHNDRVVLGPDPDLPTNTVGMVSWTRIDVFDVAEFDEARIVEFIDTHSCRFDPEGFC